MLVILFHSGPENLNKIQAKEKTWGYLPFPDSKISISMGNIQKKS